METQFDHLGIDEIDDGEYRCENGDCYIAATHFTLLMKYVLEYHKHGKILLDKIEKLVVDRPDALYETNSEKWNALHLACLHSSSVSSIEVVKLLLKLSSRNMEQHSDFVSIIKDNQFIELSIISSKLISLREIDGSKDLINAHTQGKYVPLILASGHTMGDSSIDTVKLLIEYGANVNTRLRDNDTPLLYTLHRLRPNLTNIETVKLLIECGADLNVIDDYNSTPLKYGLDNFELLNLLLESGADVTLRDNDGKNILMHAVENDYNIKILRLLIEFDRNKKNLQNRCNSDRTVLIYILEMNKYFFQPSAEQEDHKEIIKLLLENGCNMSLKYINKKVEIDDREIKELVYREKNKRMTLYGECLEYIKFNGNRVLLTLIKSRINRDVLSDLKDIWF